MTNLLWRAYMLAVLPLILLACLIPSEVDEDVSPLDAWLFAWHRDWTND